MTKIFRLLAVAVIVGCLAGAASADTFTFNVLNSTFSGTGSPIPAGVITVTQLANNSVSFQITMNHFTVNAPGNGTGQEIQYMIGMGGLEFNLANTSNLSISNVTAVNGAGNALTHIALSVGSGNYDGFGSLDVNVATTNHGNNINNSAVSFNFTLTRSVGTLAISDFQAMTSSNCGGNANSIVNTPCTFVAHINEYSVGNGANIFTGFGGTTTVPVTTPEPSSMALLGSGLMAMGGVARRRFRK